MVILTQLSEGSSSSSHKYDVFLSFRGEDTRYNFTDHLHKALVDANIHTFLGDEEIQPGEDLKPELKSAIKTSRASIIVLSTNYATSTWCLDELVLILEQRRTSEHIVIPIFYQVEPTDVRKQQNSFGDALAKHKHNMDAETNLEKRSQWVHKMELWKNALTEVADLKGKDAKGRRETDFIEEIVMDINRGLGVHLRSHLPHLIGKDNSIGFITSWLRDGSLHTADILTIWGMPGIGKTSLAKYVHALCSHEFDRSIFVEDIGRRCAEQLNGLLDSQKQLFDAISKSSPIQVHGVSAYTYKIENALPHKKVFLVLDGIDSHEQLDALLGNKGFRPGSKIIITTQDRSLTEKCALFNPIVKPKHTEHLLEGLCETESLQLLSFHAFMCNNPKKGYKKVSKRLVKYCGGHPLALKVLGSSLCNEDIAAWEDTIELLEKEINPDIQKVLQISFDSLPLENDKELFKHIASFFVGKDREFTETILDACGIKTTFGFSKLINRCLLTIGPRNELMMHQLLQDMGRDVVRQESPKKPWKRSRVWRHEEAFNVLKQEKGKGNLQGLVLDMKMLKKKKLHGSFKLKTDAFSKMDNLMLLQLNHVQLRGSYKNFPEELRWLCMHGFPLDYFPPDLSVQNLVALDMSYSNFEALNMSYCNPQQPWKRQKLNESCAKGKRLLGSLKILNLSFCSQLRRLSGFFELPALETLILKGCESLTEVCESIEQCVELVLVDLSFCSKLKKLPSMVKLDKVTTISLDGCSDLFKFPIEMKDMESLEVPNGNDISRNSQDTSSAVVKFALRIPKSILHFLPDSLVTLSLKHNNLGNDISRNSQDTSSAVVKFAPRIPKSILHFLPDSLVTLSLKHSNLVNDSFPDDFSRLSLLKFLNLEGNLIVSLPNCVRSLTRLETLRLGGCRRLESIEHPPGTLRKLGYWGCGSIRKVVFPPEMTALVDGSSSPAHWFEIEGIVKSQPIAHVEKEVLCSLGWTHLEHVKNQAVESRKDKEESFKYMYYEFGIFSTVFRGKEVPEWISHRSKGSSISFTMPSSPNNLRGLNLCIVFEGDDYTRRVLPSIIISNTTKNHTWIYSPYIISNKLRYGEGGFGSGEGVWLSHWMFGKNEMENGDEVTITIVNDRTWIGSVIIREFGINLVYDDGNMEEDPLGYYKSWNHIIGGDLSPFCLTGEYFLYNPIFWSLSADHRGHYLVTIDEGDRGWHTVLKKAFSDRKFKVLFDPQTSFLIT